MEKKNLNVDPICWVDDIVAYVGENIESNKIIKVYDNNVMEVDGREKDQLSSIPDSARNLYYLWWFKAYSGIFSVSEFMLSRAEHEIRGAYEGFLALGLPEAAQYMADAIGLILAYCDGNPDEVEWAYDFYQLNEDLSWFRGLPRSKRFPEAAALEAAVVEHHRAEDDECEFDDEGNITNLSLFSTWQGEVDLALRELCDAVDESTGQSRFDSLLHNYVVQHLDELVE